jgi:hypothetical protein
MGRGRGSQRLELFGGAATEKQRSRARGFIPLARFAFLSAEFASVPNLAYGPEQDESNRAVSFETAGRGYARMGHSPRS